MKYMYLHISPTYLLLLLLLSAKLPFQQALKGIITDIVEQMCKIYQNTHLYS